MYKNKIFTLLLVSVFLLLNACKKEDEPEPKSNVPSITFVSATPTQVKEFKDKIVFTISYKDNDGDLGQNDNTVTNCFIKDSRNGVEYKYRIQQLAPDNATIAISGTLNVELDNTSITDGSSSQSVVYTIYVKDRAGNTSNEVTSSAITVVK